MQATEIQIPETTDDLPTLSGHEAQIAEIMSIPEPDYVGESGVDFGRIRSAFIVALHMHQPLIPAGGGDLHSAAVISNLQHMMNSGDSYNAGMFQWCYKRMGQCVPQLVQEGAGPRILLDYSGCLLWGVRQMGLTDVQDSLKRLTCDPLMHRYVEWLGSAWGHAVAPSTPVQDYRLQVRAWQHHFAGMFGAEALSRVRGFSPAEMALPNHPDVLYEFVKTLKECGYRWVLLQEHTIETTPEVGPIRQPHIPHRLVARNSRGETISITAIIKTQGSDTKIVAQMQPYFEAKSVGQTNLAGKSVPPLVMQISDGENGGVMMNEFLSKYSEVMKQSTGSDTPAVGISQYLDYLKHIGISEDQFPAVQPIMQGRLWNKLGNAHGPEALQTAIEALQKEDNRFHMEGGSWTNNISWVRGYDKLLGPMERASALFSEKLLSRGGEITDRRQREALFYLLLTQTSCFRYWGQGTWTDYGRELCRRTIAVLEGL